MTKDQKMFVQNALGWSAVIITILIGSFWSYWGIMEFFHEGWHSVSVANSLFLFFVQYASLTVLFILLPLLAMRYKKIGLIVFIALAIFARFFFDGASFFTAYILIAFPLIGLGLLYFFGNIPNKKLAISLIIIFPLGIMLIAGIPQFITVMQRIDDGNYGTRTLECQGKPLVWAPRGPGFPAESHTWNEAKEICARLNRDGDAISDTVLNIWRLPDIEEAVRCQMIHNENAGGIWNKEKRRAEYEKRPDKETPLWVPDWEVIYYWTSEPSRENEEQAYIIDYKGGIFDKDMQRKPNYQSFRCVTDASKIDVFDKKQKIR